MAKKGGQKEGDRKGGEAVNPHWPTFFRSTNCESRVLFG